MKGSVEFVAPTEYMMRPPMPPVYFFLIDVSVSAVRSGMIEVRTFTYMEDFAATHLVLYNGIVFSHMKHSLYTAIEIVRQSNISDTISSRIAVKFKYYSLV